MFMDSRTCVASVAFTYVWGCLKLFIRVQTDCKIYRTTLLASGRPARSMRGMFPKFLVALCQNTLVSELL